MFRTRLLLPLLVLGVGCPADDDSEPAATDTDAVATDSASGSASNSAGSSMSGTSAGTTSGTSAGTSGGTSAGTTADSDTVATSDSDPTTGEGTSGSSGGPDDTGETTVDTEAESDSSSEQGGGTIDVTLDGCTIDLGGTVVVSYNGSLGVASVYDSGSNLTGSFQFDIPQPGTMQLSTQHRVDTETVVNLVDTTSTWTNLDPDSFGDAMDRVSGTLAITDWNPSEGQSSIAFTDVALVNVVDNSVCTINGTIETTELYP